MIKFKAVVVVVLALGALGRAQAYDVRESAGFQFNGPFFTPNGQGPSWATDATIYSWVNGDSPLNESLGFARYPYDFEGGSGTINRPMPESYARINSPGIIAWAGSTTGHSLNAVVELTGESQASAGSSWRRGFSLNPYGSITLSGHGGVSDVGALTQFNSSTIGSLTPYSALSVRSADGLQSLELNGFIFGSSHAGASVSNMFSYTTDGHGALALTITNPTGQILTGSLGVSTFASAVPEPSTYLSMLLGLGVVGAIARRKSAQPGLPALV
jgi:hypothetical protein